MERHNRNELEEEKQTKDHDTRVDIHVISYRTRKHDPDGVSVKAALDGIVVRGILQDDSTSEVRKVTFESRISKEEKTIIEITSV